MIISGINQKWEEGVNAYYFSTSATIPFSLAFFFFFFHKQHFFYPSLWPAVKAVIPTAVSAAGTLAVLLHVLQWQARCRFAVFSPIFPNKTCTRKLWWGSGDRPEQGGVPGTRLWLPHWVEDDPVPWFQIFPWKFFQGRLGSTARLSDPGSFQVRLVIPVFVWL